MWMFEKGRRFGVENGMVHQYLLGVVNWKGNPVPNVEMYYTAYGLYKYRREVVDHAEEGLLRNPTFTRRQKRWITTLRNVILSFTLACS